MRTTQNGAALGLAACRASTRSPMGTWAGNAVRVALAFANAALFAGYIVLAHPHRPKPGIAGIDGLAGAMLAAAVAIHAGGARGRPRLSPPLRSCWRALESGVTSSVIPYICDRSAMARLPRATPTRFSSRYLPATATAIGIVVLGQIPTAVEVAGVGLA